MEPPAPSAVLDIGTNTVLLLVGRRGPDGAVEVIEDRARITRLGEGLARGSALRPAAVERTLAALSDHVARARALGVPGGRIVAAATAGVRMATDAEAFLARAAQVVGLPVRVLSGEEEAALSFASVAADEPAGPLRVLDIGGGSTELAVGRDGKVSSVASFRLGSVHLWERFAGADPPGREGFEAMAAHAAACLAERPVSPHPRLSALAGTATTTAALLLGLSTYDRTRVDGSTFEREAVRGLGAHLAAMPIEARSRLPCLPTGRADVIVAGIAILVAALDHCGAKTLVVRDRGHRYALLP